MREERTRWERGSNIESELKENGGERNKRYSERRERITRKGKRLQRKEKEERE